MRILIIPARSGSKRIPNKNIRPFLGVPALVRTLAVARESDTFDIIHVSTDSAEIASIASRAGADPGRLRPQSLANDDIPLREVMIHEASEILVSEFGASAMNPDGIQVWLMLPCAVLTVPRDLRLAAQLLDSKASNEAVLSVAEYPAPIEWAMAVSESGVLEIAQPDALSTPSQAFSPHYYDTGMFAGFALSALWKMRDKEYHPTFLPVTIDSWRAIDIDTLTDWENAERIFPLLGGTSQRTYD